MTGPGVVARLARRARDSLWALPLACMLAGVLLAVGTAGIDRAVHELVPRWITGPPTAAQTVLSTIATSMVTLITIVLTVTTVAVQLAMGQFSPRIVGALLRDRPSQLAHGLFAATFAFAVIGVSQVDDQAPGGGRVPGLTILVAYALVLASVVTLILYVHHAGQSLRVASMIDLVGDDLRLQLVRRFPDPVAGGAEEAEEPRVVPAVESGVVVEVDERRLVEVAAGAGCRLELLVAMGDFVPAGAALFRVTDGDPSRLPDDVCALVRLGPERTHVDDPAYGFRKLVDIAERTASSSGGDPTTAVQAIDRLHDCLRYMACRDIPDGRHRDADGVVRLEVPVLGWDGYVRLSFDELRLMAGPSPQVSRRMEAALRDLWTVAPADRRPALERQLRLLAGEVERALAAGDDARAGVVADMQGIGSGHDVLTPLRGGDGSHPA